MAHSFIIKYAIRNFFFSTSMNLYTVSVPVFMKNLKNLKQILAKGKTFAAEQGMSEAELLDARLAPDMFPLMRQVQIASDNAKSISANLASVEKPVMEDVEKSFDELMERCDKTIAFLETLKPEQFEGAEARQIPFPYAEGKWMLGNEALLHHNLPNFFFHMVTAYAILRNKGVTLGKNDYIGELPLKP